MECGAKTRSDTPCRRSAMPNGRCYLHGGATPVGIANANFKHGRYSKYLPTKLRARYEEGLSDPELLELRSEVALLDARLSELLDKAKTGETSGFWQDLNKVWVQYRTAIQSDDVAEQTRLFVLLNDAINTAGDESKAWFEIQKLLEQRRKLVDTEQRRMHNMQQMVTVGQTMALVAATIYALKEAVYRHVDPMTAKHIIVDASVAHQRLTGVNQHSEQSE